ncbi:hypothetical protein ACFQLX_01400 [Streptomyces polyrhachis]|uniref:Uncharacterized protein n=1 Tax=Streptomyces polyrhachis TaxID=1282885 RepID=A0ABW2G7X0_9ACTN
MVIEQAQILTTHNLAALVRPVGVTPATGWADLAYRSFRTACSLTARVHHNPRPLATIKDVAYAWRHTLCYLSLCTSGEQAATITQLEDEVTRHASHVIDRLAPVLAGLRLIAAGGTFDPDGTAHGGRARRLQAWSATGHWMRTAAAVPDVNPCGSKG